MVSIYSRERWLYELTDGVLLEKAAGRYESYLAMLVGASLTQLVATHNLGIALVPDGMLRLAPGLARIPDVGFISCSRLPQRRVPRAAIADLAPDLAVEVIHRGNTREEMERKRRDYFGASVAP